MKLHSKITENIDKEIQEIKINNQTLYKEICFINVTVGSNFRCLKFV